MAEPKRQPEREKEEMKLGEDIIHEPIRRKDTSIGRIWRYRFVPYKSGTVSHPSFTVELYHNGELVSFGTSVHSLYMAALIAKDHYKRKEGVSKSSAASTLGRLGGLAKSEAKAISSRENGKKGGRPRKVREEEKEIDSANLDLFK